MDNRYYDKVIGEMKDFFEENNFRAEDKVFKNDHVSVKIEYDEKAQTYNLLVAEIEEEKIGEYSVASVYLFDDSQLERDAAAVGIDPGAVQESWAALAHEPPPFVVQILRAPKSRFADDALFCHKTPSLWCDTLRIAQLLSHKPAFSRLHPARGCDRVN